MTAPEPTRPADEHTDAVALDLDAVEAEFLRQCGGCDAGLMVGCTCSQRDFRPTMLALVAEVRRLIESRSTVAANLAASLLRAEAEVRTLRAKVNGLHEELLRGDPDVVTLRARLAAVEALTVDWPCSDDTCDGDCTGCAYASDLRAALATTGEGQ